MSDCSPTIYRPYSEDDVDSAFHSFRTFKDRDFREHQFDTIYRAANSNKSVVVINAPTGIGKSVIGATLCRMIGNSIYLVHSKALQEQIYDDFPEFKILKGRNNYPCINNTCYPMPRSAAECPFREPQKNCEYFSKCPYKVQKKLVTSHPLRVLNYSYMFSEWNFVGGLSGIPLVVADEADTLEGELLGFISLSFNDRNIAEFELEKPSRITPTAHDAMSIWRDWASRARDKVEKTLTQINKDGVPQDKIDKYRSMYFKLSRFIKIVDETWIYDSGENRFGKYYSFKPTWISPELTDSYLRKHIMDLDKERFGKLVLMSATVPPIQVLSTLLGIPVNEIEYIDVPSTFDPKKRPTVIASVANMSAKTAEAEFKYLKRAVFKILKAHPNDKGLIHTSNYKIAEWLMETKHPRFMTHNAVNRIEMLDRFKNSTDPVVMISPSMERGVSLNDDLCRFLIVGKTPYPDLQDKQTSERLFSTGGIGKYWYKSMTAQTIEQECGRGTRSKDDYCTIYLLDTHTSKLIAEHRTLFSNYFLSCLTYESDVNFSED